MRGATLLCALLLASAPPAAAQVSDGRMAMGTVLEIRLEGVAQAQGRALLERLFARAQELEQVFTRFDERSALSALNAGAGPRRRPVPADLARLLADAAAWSARTRGAFDVTVGPLVELWTRAAERGAPPSGEELRAARARVGAHRMRADPGAGEVALEPGTSIDLGGVAKGYALDVLVRMLAEDGVGAALLSFGGSSLHALGTPPGEDAWRVALRDTSGEPAGVLLLRDRALSVSASLGQSTRIGDRRYGHVIDPRTGAALERDRIGAVVAPSGVGAEALSKALLVLDALEAIALARSLPGVDAWLIDSDGTERATPGFLARVESDAPEAAAH
jgi:thiamine biosynthesis lipoprotein